MQHNQATVLAALATIGGIDERVRLGGVAQHSEWGTCTIASISASGKILVQPQDSDAKKMCRFNDLAVVRCFQINSKSCD